MLDLQTTKWVNAKFGIGRHKEVKLVSSSAFQCCIEIKVDEVRTVRVDMQSGTSPENSDDSHFGCLEWNDAW